MIYGHPNEPAEIHFQAENGSVTALKTKFPGGAPTDNLLRVGSHRVRVLAMSSDMADRTWFLQGGSLIACGPDYVGAVTDTGGALRLETEQRGLDTDTHPLPLLLYGEGPPVPLGTITLPSTSRPRRRPLC